MVITKLDTKQNYVQEQLKKYAKILVFKKRKIQKKTNVKNI